MNINWVLGDQANLGGQDPQNFKNIGSLWGSWRTWKTCHTDNVICYNHDQARTLIQTDFADKCNFYVPENLFKTLDNPSGIKSYAGEFSHPITNPEEILAMLLASSVSDIVLLMGFDWPATRPTVSESQKYYDGMVYHIIGSSKAQWVHVDAVPDSRQDLAKFPNYTTDTLTNVFGLLAN